VEGRLDFALETLFSCKRRCDLAICGNGGELRSCDEVEMGKREQSFSAPRMEGVWLAHVQLVIPLEVDQGGEDDKL